jgi:hypothetical protein
MIDGTELVPKDLQQRVRLVDATCGEFRLTKHIPIGKVNITVFRARNIGTKPIRVRLQAATHTAIIISTNQRWGVQIVSGAILNQGIAPALIHSVTWE